jgi:uncharacterized protein (TIGR02186 family)
MKNNFLFLLFFSSFLAIAVRSEVSANQITVELSSNQVQINTGFNGIDLLLFGTTNGADDIIIVIKGPPETNLVRKKSRVAGIWANTEKALIKNTPNFYALATTRPLDQISNKSILQAHEIGIENLSVSKPEEERKSSSTTLYDYRQALFRLKSELGLFIIKPLKINLIQNQLFKTEVHFPPNMSTGTYMAQIYSFKKGILVDTINKPISVEKVGIGAQVFELAHKHSALYGILAIFIAVASGWIAAIIFRKV